MLGVQYFTCDKSNIFKIHNYSEESNITSLLEEFCECVQILKLSDDR